MPSSPGLVPASHELLDVLLAGDEARGTAAFGRALATGAGRTAVFERIVGPCLHELGERWARAAITAADEHRASEVLTSVLRAHAAPDPGAGAPVAVVGCPPGELHALAAWMAREVLVEAGWHVHFLGASTPAPALLEYARRQAPDLLVLTTTCGTELDQVRAITRELGAHPGPPAMIVGGAGVPEGTGAADLHADAVGRRLPALLAFAEIVRARGTHHAVATPPEPDPALARGGKRQGQKREQLVLAALAEARAPLTLSEVHLCCGGSLAATSAALMRLQTRRLARPTPSGRWTTR